MHNQSTTPTISVIVPVYNAEKYLRRCIDSVLAQTYTDFELLLIDDGSKDKSGEICDEYAQKDTRVRVFHQENGGVSSARNLGLDNAKGEWVTFVDSDDEIEPEHLQAYEMGLDAHLVVGNAVVKVEGKKDHILSSGIPVGYHKEFKPLLSHSLTKLIFQAPWGKLFNRKCLANLRYDTKLITGEDNHFIFRYLCQSDSLRVLPCDLKESQTRYVYRPLLSAEAKYQISVASSVYHLLALEDAYQKLGVRDKAYEIFCVYAYYERCMNDLPVHGELWYNNRDIERICLRRSSHFGIFVWVKTWLSFHFFYRLKMHQVKKHKY